MGIEASNPTLFEWEGTPLCLSAKETPLFECEGRSLFEWESRPAEAAPRLTLTTLSKAPFTNLVVAEAAPRLCR